MFKIGKEMLKEGKSNGEDSETVKGYSEEFLFLSARKNAESNVWSRHINYYFLSFKPSLKASPTRSVTL